MNQRLVFCLAAAAIVAPLPAAAQAGGESQTEAQRERDLRASILSGCNLRAWQFSVRIMPDGAIVPAISPSVPTTQQKCVSQMLHDAAANAS